MIVLDATTRKLQMKLAGAITTNQLPIVASYVDLTTTTYSPGSNNIATNSGTAVDVVAAPAASTQRQVKMLTVVNADTAAATLTVIYNDNGTLRNICVITLAVGDILVYTDGEGFRVYDSTGSIKTSFSNYQPLSSVLTSLSSNTAPSGTLVGTTDTQTLTNKRKNMRLVTLADGATVTPNIDNGDVYELTTTQNFTLANPTGTPVHPQLWLLTVKGASAFTIAYGSKYRGGDQVLLPSALTGSSKWDHFLWLYHTSDDKYDLIARSPGY